MREWYEIKKLSKSGSVIRLLDYRRKLWRSISKRIGGADVMTAIGFNGTTTFRELMDFENKLTDEQAAQLKAAALMKSQIE